MAILALLGIWQLWCTFGDVEPWVLPPPSAVITAGWHAREALVSHAGTTLTEAVVGLAAGTAVGVAVAIIVSSSSTLRDAAWPVIVTSQTIPVVAMAPLFALWFGYDLTPKIVLVGMFAFFPVTVSTVVGLGGVDQGQIDLVRSFGATRRQMLRTVRIPAALPEFFSGLRIATAYAMGTAVVGEYIGGSSGLGIFIDRSRVSYQTDQMLAGVLVISILSVILFSLVGALGRRCTPWRTQPQIIGPIKENQ